MLRPAFYRLAEAGDSIGVQMSRVMAQQMGGTAPGEVAETPVFIEDRPFRPIFGRCAELGVVACVHPSSNVTGADAVTREI